MLSNPSDSNDLHSKSNSSDYSKEMKEIWSKLNDLAKDPEAYKNYLQYQFKNLRHTENDSKLDNANSEDNNMKTLSHVVEPGLVIRTKGQEIKGSKRHYINVCHSMAVQPPPKHDPNEVPIVMSKQRIGLDSRKMIFHVYDAVVHTSVFEKALLQPDFKKMLTDLAVQCVQETFHVSLNEKGYTSTMGKYEGPFGWDEKGTPLSNEEAHERERKKQITPETLLSQVTQLQAQEKEPKKDIQIMNHEKRSLKEKSIQKQNSVGKVLIEEISSSSSESKCENSIEKKTPILNQMALENKKKENELEKNEPLKEVDKGSGLLHVRTNIVGNGDGLVWEISCSEKVKPKLVQVRPIFNPKELIIGLRVSYQNHSNSCCFDVFCPQEILSQYEKGCSLKIKETTFDRQQRKILVYAFCFS